MQASRRLIPHSLYYVMFSNRRTSFEEHGHKYFPLSAIFICSNACFIYFYSNKPNTKNEPPICRRNQNESEKYPSQVLVQLANLVHGVLYL